MIKTILLNILLLLASCIVGCQTNRQQRIEEKNECFSRKLIELNKSDLYKTVLKEFEDTFKVLRNEKQYFGIPSYAENVIDAAVFFKRDSTQCLLIVLQKVKDNLVFGSARIIQGTRNSGHWKFEVSIEYNFEKDFFKDYNENNFENISKLARYGVLVRNNVNKEGCDINDEYWFSYLK